MRVIVIIAVLAGFFLSAPARSDELDDRMAYWSEKLPFCENWGGAPFPSKEDDSSQPCNDGDSVALNGLMCTVGDERACDSVRRSQAVSGFWSRSPKRAAVGSAETKGTETAFSRDHVAGVWAYIAVKKDREAFKRWTEWVREHKLAGIYPAYCHDLKCGLWFSDCPMLDRLALIIGEGNAACDPLPFKPDEEIAKLQAGFDFVINEIRKVPASGILIPGIDFLKDSFDKSMKVLRDATAALEEIRIKQETFVRAMTNTAALITNINSVVNGDGSERHGVAYSAYLLEKYGIVSAGELALATSELTSKSPQNAFFEYVKSGPTPHMLDIILTKCKARATDTPHPRFQWQWERNDDNEEAIRDSMYWDCLFVGKLFRQGPIKQVAFTRPPGFDLAYKAAEMGRNQALDHAKLILTTLQDTVKQFPRPTLNDLLNPFTFLGQGMPAAEKNSLPAPVVSILFPQIPLPQITAPLIITVPKITVPNIPVPNIPVPKIHIHF